MKRILITGCKGQLGREIQELSVEYKDMDFEFTDVEELDITDESELNKFLAADNFDYIINAAGYTAVDKAEKEKDKAGLINSYAVELLSKATAKHNIILIHISTDFVFGGEKNTPYTESDQPAPLSAYSESKYNGEKNFLQFAKKGLIIRTSWLYSSYGHNFVKTIMKYGKQKDELNVVFDQTGTPTYANDLAKAILHIVNSEREITTTDIYHYSNEGITSWYDFAHAVIELAAISCKINPVETKDYPLPSKRPQYSVMNKNKIKTKYNLLIPYWRDSLKICIERIKSEC